MSRLGSLQLENQIGMRLSVDVESVDDAFAQMRRFGALGWTSGELPDAGWVLPYEMHDRFDWRLIGARGYTVRGDDGNDEHRVIYRGATYKRRELEGIKKGGKELPKAVKYSRGAKASDAENAVAGDGDIKYRTLITFVGGGRALEELCVPRAGSDDRNAAPKPAAQPTPRPGTTHTAEPESGSKILTDRHLARIRTLAGGRGIDLDSDQFRELVRSAGSDPKKPIESITCAAAQALIAKLELIPLPTQQAAPAAPPAVTPMPPRMAENVLVTLNRVIPDADRASDLIATVSDEIDGCVVYDVYAMSVAAGNEILKRLRIIRTIRTTTGVA
jgi:hypothetical protein